MKKKNEKPQLTRENLIALLTAKNGEAMNMAELGAVYGVNQLRIASLATDLVSAGVLREVMTSRRHAAYFLPTERQLAAERAAREMADTFRPLKPRPLQAAAVARAREVRDQYPSIV